MGAYRGQMDFDVVNIQHDVILGMKWLEHANPTIDWKTKRMQLQVKGFNLTVDPIDYQPKAELVSSMTMMQLMKNNIPVYVCNIREDGSSDPPVPATQDPQLLAMLETYKDIFPEELPAGLPPKRKVEFRIPLKPNTVVRKRPMFPLSPAELEVLKEEIDRLVRLGHIQPSTSELGANILFAKKKDGKLRMCIDYRDLNEATITEMSVIPLTAEGLARFGKANLFSVIDLKSGYHQIRVADEDVYKTAFRTRFGHYEFLVMPFGLKNAPTTFQALMNDVFKDYLDEHVWVYIDDILVYTEDRKTHLEILQKVFDLLRTNTLFANPKKCEFLKTHIKYLGFIVGQTGIAADLEKTAAIDKLERPTTLTGLRSLLGMMNYYRRFIENYSAIAAPLTALTKTGANIKKDWMEEHQAAFKNLQKRLVTAPILINPDPTKRYTVTTDASTIAVGAVLSQEGRPVAYFSRKLNSAEQNYPIHELEELAIVEALRHWRHYLEGAAEETEDVTDQ